MRECLTHDDVKDFIETQLMGWPLAKKNYDALIEVKRRPFFVGGLQGAVQWNPARIVSTGAKTDVKSISQRPCFLCRSNRPKEQISLQLVEGWDLLVNPFPILPIHFTIVAKEHRPQDELPLDIVAFAEKLPGMAVFYNGAKAGASAPDHLHMQAVLKDELPLLCLVEKIHNISDSPLVFSSNLRIDMPFVFWSGIVTPDKEGFATLKKAFSLGGLSEDGSLNNKELLNAFFWISKAGLLRFVIIPRRSHRPACYYEKNDKKRVISPGAIDMAGLIVTPRKEDYDSLSKEEITVIYKEVAL